MKLSCQVLCRWHLCNKIDQKCWRCQNTTARASDSISMDNCQQYEVEWCKIWIITLCYGYVNAQIKEETHYTSPSGNKIEVKNFVKDLGMIQSLRKLKIWFPGYYGPLFQAQLIQWLLSTSHL